MKLQEKMGSVVLYYNPTNQHGVIVGPSIGRLGISEVSPDFSPPQKRKNGLAQKKGWTTFMGKKTLSKDLSLPYIVPAN